MPRRPHQAKAAALIAAAGVKRDRDGLIRCRVCGSTEREACDPPCSWAEPDLCTGCADGVDALVEWFEGARKANLTALLREVDRESALLRR